MHVVRSLMYICKCKGLFIPVLFKAHFVKFDACFCKCFPLISGILPIWHKVCLTKVSKGLSTMSYLSKCLHNFLKLQFFKQYTISSCCTMISSQVFCAEQQLMKDWLGCILSILGVPWGSLGLKDMPQQFCSLFWANVGTSTMQPFFVVTNNKDESKT